MRTQNIRTYLVGDRILLLDKVEIDGEIEYELFEGEDCVSDSLYGIPTNEQVKRWYEGGGSE